MLINKSTIQSLIDIGKESKLTTNDLSLKTVVTNSNDNMFVINMSSIFDKYYEILLDHAVTVTFDEEDYLKYRFKPKVLSQDIYGTKDLHFLLLRLNNITSVAQFDFKEVKVFEKSIIKLLNEILILEEDNYTDNEIEIIKKING